MAQYVEIVEIVAPAEAVAGSRVDTTVKVKNKYTGTLAVMVVGFPEYPGLPPGEYINGLYPYEAMVGIDPGVTHSFAGYFIMPSSDVKIRAYGYYYWNNMWNLDDEKTKDVKLAELVPAFSEFAVASFQKG